MTAPVVSPTISKTVPLGTVPNGTVFGGKLELRKAAESFEAVFLRQIISEMRRAKLADDIFGSGATDSFREMADANSAETLAARGSFGIANMLEAQFKGKA
jgi:peptidoglycan hydrolase FlgJ